MKYILETKKISKYFESSNVQANKDVDIKLSKGEIHAVIGENGAGKTTLMNILYGLVSPDSSCQNSSQAQLLSARCVIIEKCTFRISNFANAQNQSIDSPNTPSANPTQPPSRHRRFNL